MEKPGAEFCEAAWGSIEPGGSLYLRPGIWVHEEGCVTSTGVSDDGKFVSLEVRKQTSVWQKRELCIKGEILDKVRLLCQVTVLNDETDMSVCSLHRMGSWVTTRHTCLR